SSPLEDGSGFATVGAPCALASLPSVWPAKRAAAGTGGPKSWCGGVPLSQYQLPKWRACPGVGEIWRSCCTGSVRQSSTKDPGKPGPVELQPKKMGQVRLATSKP